MVHSFATHDLESNRPEDVEIERDGLRVQVFPIEGPGAAAQRAASVDEYVSHGQGGQFLGMALQPDQIVEGVDATQLAGVDQAHEQITDLRPVQGAERTEFLRCRTIRINALSAKLLSSGALNDVSRAMDGLTNLARPRPLACFDSSQAFSNNRFLMTLMESRGMPMIRKASKQMIGILTTHVDRTRCNEEHESQSYNCPDCGLSWGRA
jgi:hypothetical protein